MTIKQSDHTYEAHLPRGLGQVAEELWGGSSFGLIKNELSGAELIFTFRGRKDRRAALIALHTHVKDIIAGCRRDQPNQTEL